MPRTLTRSRIAATAAAGAVTAAVALGGAAPASAAASTSVRLAPGQSTCISQYASFQVRAEGQASWAGARFKLLRNGEVIEATPGRVNYWVTERRTAYGDFPGPGVYSACAFNTGTTNTNVTLDLRTDFEI
jgi:hypothetical protein